MKVAPSRATTPAGSAPRQSEVPTHRLKSGSAGGFLPLLGPRCPFQGAGLIAGLFDDPMTSSGPERPGCSAAWPFRRQVDGGPKHPRRFAQGPLQARGAGGAAHPPDADLVLGRHRRIAGVGDRLDDPGRVERSFIVGEGCPAGGQVDARLAHPGQFASARSRRDEQAAQVIPSIPISNVSSGAPFKAIHQGGLSHRRLPDSGPPEWGSRRWNRCRDRALDGGQSLPHALQVMDAVVDIGNLGLDQGFDLRGPSLRMVAEGQRARRFPPGKTPGPWPCG